MLNVVGLTLLLAASSMAFAGDGRGPSPPPCCKNPPPPCCMKAPEIDARSAIAGLTLLAGSLAVIRGRRAKAKGNDKPLD